MPDAPSAEDIQTPLIDAAIDRFAAASDVEVPQGQVDEEVERMVSEFNHKLKYGSMFSGGYLGLLQEDLDDRLEKIKEEAYKLVKLRLVLRGIIEAQNFVITKEELEEEAKAISVRQNMPVQMVKDFLGEDLSSLKDDLLVRKALDFIRAHC